MTLFPWQPTQAQAKKGCIDVEIERILFLFEVFHELPIPSHSVGESEIGAHTFLCFSDLKSPPVVPCGLDLKLYTSTTGGDL
jgi:hypothetical protein